MTNVEIKWQCGMCSYEWWQAGIREPETRYLGPVDTTDCPECGEDDELDVLDTR